MEFAVMADTLSLSHHFTMIETLQISSLILPIDAVAPPPVRSRSRSTCRARRTLLKGRRTRRRSQSPDGGDDAGFFISGGDDAGFFGGGSGGRGWNSDGFGGGFNWDDSSSSYPDDPAFDFVYEVVCWIVFSNCLHFAFKKVARLASEEREKFKHGVHNHLGTVLSMVFFALTVI